MSGYGGFGSLEQHMGDDFGSLGPMDTNSAGQGSQAIFSTRPVPMDRAGLGDTSTVQRHLASMAAGNGIVLTGLRNGELARWYTIENESSPIDFGRDRCTDISRVFLEPKGFHALITSNGGDTWYLNIHGAQAKLLPKLRGHELKAIAWDLESTESSTKDLIIGTLGGQLLHLVVEGKERTLRTLFVFELGSAPGVPPEMRATEPVSGVYHEKTVLAADGTERHIVFAAAGCGVYAFIGSSLETMFQKYQGEGAAKRALVYEVPRDSPHGDLQVDHACMGPPGAKVLFWLTGVGVLAAQIKTPLQNDKDILEQPPGLIPLPRSPKARTTGGSLFSSLLPAPPPTPLCMALTSYHIIFVFEDRWAAVSRVNHEVVQQQEWSRSTLGALRGLARDSHEDKVWLCSDKFLFEIEANREDRDVWSSLLRLEKFDEAVSACKSKSQQLRVLAEHADWLFRKGRLIESARKFAEATNVPFEHVALRFAGPEKKGALLEYMRERLSRGPADDKVARALLFVWSVELSLAYLDDLSVKAGASSPSKPGSDYQAPPTAVDASALPVTTVGGEGGTRRRRLNKQELERLRRQERGRLHELLRDCAGFDVQSIIYHLLQSHGFLEELALSAEARRDFTTVILHHVSRRDFAGAIQKLGEYQAMGECEELLSRFAPVLFKAEPKSLVSLLMQPQLAGIGPLAVLPAVAAWPTSSSLHQAEAIRYLENAIQSHGELMGHPLSEGEQSALAGGLCGTSMRRGGGTMGDAGGLLLDSDIIGAATEDATAGPALPKAGWGSGGAVVSALIVLHARGCKRGSEEEEGEDDALTELPDSDAPVIDWAGDAEDALLRFLKLHESNPLLDLHFALRVCGERGLARSVVQLYGLMGLHEEAVDAALKRGDIALAKQNCHPADERLRQKLWLRIVESQAMSSGDAHSVVQTIVGLMHESKALTVRDVLPYMSDMITIDAFQDEIRECLDKYKDHVLTLRQEMDDHRRALADFKEDLKKAEQREMIIPEDQACEICGEAAVRERFYAFSCRHCFHEACLRDLITPTLTEDMRKQLFKLEAKRIEHQAAATVHSLSMLDAGSRGASLPGGLSATEIAEVEEELDGILADDCPLCGRLMIQTIRRPFIDPFEEAEVESWAIA
eukprot:TRINITY_DN111502_c0_g1_i1.p1 TRINITY_DN111502_c0_g1~~TRINITY_DN111502_c0_g1_i1.p1  ORF type:complete len:1137 (+),score=204.22 TRINITY_DN111502_c0_g1_i1:82-3492(+)